ncbi:BolA family transcriptional regulator [uncultured Lentibacter sp.]|uniref:BolA family protein n=1 Tax=uncultured Lentibacter sp. TaxID=1659309 RepID=UPI00263A25B4|nr:BolA family protein [uncultured Lentibacter sp.]MCW1955316.1 BolA family transcriptional regulator [Roseobacter sp.]
MNMEAKIRAALVAAFEATALEVINESHQHSGHAGDDGSGESHFRVRMTAAGFDAMSRVARHRAVHAALGPLNEQIHALALELS